MFERGSDATTRRLSGASFSLAVNSTRKGMWRGLVVLFFVLLCLGVAAFMAREGASPEARLRAEVQSLAAENTRIQQELSDLKMVLGHERATRESLEKESSQQAESLRLANKNLAFYRNHSGDSAQTSP
jgi:ABC-type multidrug transport system fused ATPase/permease subunit